MRVVFMGSPEFASIVLGELASSFEVVGVYTQPDRVRGRGGRLEPTPVKKSAQDLGLDVHTPNTLKDARVADEIRSLAPDVICVAAYGKILPRELLDIPKYGCINVHASLLPRWRGAAPIERAILAGDEHAGVCIMRMEEGLDTGDYCIARSILIEDMDVGALTAELAHLGAAASVSAICMLEDGSAKWTPQKDEGVTYAEKLSKEELWLSPDLLLEDNLRRVRASGPAHPARARIAGKDATVLSARKADFPYGGKGLARGMQEGLLPAGSVLDFRERLVLACADGALEVLRLKPAGKREMDARAYLAGAKLSDDAAWSAIG